jgi:hypothetical protein
MLHLPPPRRGKARARLDRRTRDGFGMRAGFGTMPSIDIINGFQCPAMGYLNFDAGEASRLRNGHCPPLSLGRPCLPRTATVLSILS